MKHIYTVCEINGSPIANGNENGHESMKNSNWLSNYFGISFISMAPNERPVCAFGRENVNKFAGFV